MEQVTLTTNGVLLEKQAGALKRAGVDCINVSLDTLDPRLYRQITGQDALEKVVAGILQAEKLDIPVHANTVLPKSINDAVWQQVLSLAEKGYADVRSQHHFSTEPLGFFYLFCFTGSPVNGSTYSFSVI